MVGNTKKDTCCSFSLFFTQTIFFFNTWLLPSSVISARNQDMLDDYYHGCPLVESETNLQLIRWIAQVSDTCVYGQQAAFSWSLGYISIIAWLGAQMPQIVTNYLNQSVDGLSFAFLANWFMGDLFNFWGCVLTRQLPFQTLLAAYYIFVDFILSGQYYYYTRPHRMLNRERTILKRQMSYKKHRSKASSAKTRPIVVPSSSTRDLVASSSLKSMVGGSFLASSFTQVKAMPLPLQPSYKPAFLIPLNTVGILFAWLCTSLYISSRLPQIYKNYTRKSTSGTSICLFLAALIGNSAYTLSILLSPQVSSGGRQFLIKELPFLLGAAGTVFFDATIFVQWYLYKAKTKQDDDQTKLPKPQVWYIQKPHTRASHQDTAQLPLAATTYNATGGD